MPLHMVAVLAERRALELLKLAFLAPHPRGLRDGDAGVLRCVHPTSYLMPGLNEEGIIFLLRFASLDVSSAFLVEIICDPGCLVLLTRFPRALAYRRHGKHFEVRRFPFIPSGSDNVAGISDCRGFNAREARAHSLGVIFARRGSSSPDRSAFGGLDCRIRRLLTAWSLVRVRPG